mmetsp:Transcript_52283/g.131276  ORF Transcript_52283/g.131276 Transcript_52283/m.131276 type:complete len:226 (-) Transcript_52283:409-1086(-)
MRLSIASMLPCSVLRFWLNVPSSFCSSSRSLASEAAMLSCWSLSRRTASAKVAASTCSCWRVCMRSSTAGRACSCPSILVVHWYTLSTLAHVAGFSRSAVLSTPTPDVAAAAACSCFIFLNSSTSSFRRCRTPSKRAGSRLASRSSMRARCFASPPDPTAKSAPEPASGAPTIASRAAILFSRADALMEAWAVLDGVAGLSDDSVLEAVVDPTEDDADRATENRS